MNTLNKHNCLFKNILYNLNQFTCINFVELIHCLICIFWKCLIYIQFCIQCISQFNLYCTIYNSCHFTCNLWYNFNFLIYNQAYIKCIFPILCHHTNHNFRHFKNIKIFQVFKKIEIRKNFHFRPIYKQFSDLNSLSKFNW